MEPFDSLAEWAFDALGLEGTSLIATLIAISMLCQLVSRLIPDDKTGWLGVVRKVCSVLGLYVSNRIATGISVNAVTTAAATIPSVAKRVDDIVDPKVNSHWVAGVLAVGLAVLLMGCSPMGQALESAGNKICQNYTAVYMGLVAAQSRAVLIEDNIKREAALSALNVSFAALAECPQAQES